MNILEVFKFSFESLKDRRVRSSLTILMVVIGASLIVSLNGMSAGMNVFITQQFGKLAPDILFITAAPVIQTAGGTRANPIQLDARTVQTIKSVSGVKDIFPVVSSFAQARSGGSSMQVMVLGMDQTKAHYIAPNLGLEEGNIVSPYDSIGVLVGYEVAYPPGQTKPFIKVGQTLSLEYSRIESQGLQERQVTEKRNFVVRGVLNRLGTGGGGFFQMDNIVLTSLSSAGSFFEKSGKYDAIIVVTRSPDINNHVEEGIRKIYGSDIGVTSPKSIVETIQGFISGFSIFLSSIAAVSLIVAAVGVITTLLTSVLERTREVGVLKAIGFKERSIMGLFLCEAAIIGMIGASIGILVGMGLSSVMLTALFGGGLGMASVTVTPIYLLNDLLFVWLFATAISIIAGLYPAWRASRLDPVVALRKE